MFRRLLRRMSRGAAAHRRTGLDGDYTTWEEARRDSCGYDSDDILEKALRAALAVEHGEAVCERDTVLFDHMEYSWPLVAGIMWAAAQSTSPLSVIDIGGGLGTTYRQCRPFLDDAHDYQWHVVEQPHWAQAGHTHFENNRLHFHTDIEHCLEQHQPAVAVLSSVLQYLEEPFAVLDRLFDSPVTHIVIDRTTFWEGPRHRICVQTVDPSIYDASYPTWMFSVDRFREALSDYVVTAESRSKSEEASLGCQIRGFLLSRTPGKGRSRQ